MSCLRANTIFAMIAFKLGMADDPFDKSSADTFEAYVNLLLVDNMAALIPWIESIFTPLVQYAADNYLRRK